METEQKQIAGSNDCLKRSNISNSKIALVAINQGCQQVWNAQMIGICTG